jgi:hypothetical protein
LASKLKELEQRLAALEEEVTRLRQRVDPPLDETPAEHGARLIREARADQARSSAHMDRVFAAMGITGEAPGIEKLREMQREHAEERARQSRKKRGRSQARSAKS